MFSLCMTGVWLKHTHSLTNISTATTTSTDSVFLQVQGTPISLGLLFSLNAVACYYDIFRD